MEGAHATRRDDDDAAWIPSVHQDALEKLRRFVQQSDEYPKAAVVYGPAGSGKSALCRRFAQQYAYQVDKITWRQLAGSTVGDVEQQILHTMRRCCARASGASAAARTVILVDELEIWATRSNASQWGLRVVAAFHDALQELREERTREVVVLTTCCEVRDVHDALRRHGMLGCEIALGALRATERAAVCAKWAMWAHATEENVVEDTTTHVVSMTAGFMVAELVALLRRVGAARHGRHDMRHTVDTTRPGTLAATTSLLRDTNLDGIRRACVAPTLIGVEGALKQVLDCVHSVGELARSNAARRWSASSTRSARALRGVKGVRGVLVHGASGCGKSAVLRVAALRAMKLGMHVLQVDVAAVLGAHVGASERRVRALFGAARVLAPCALVLEDVDSLAPARVD
ncbi:unnamed protein product, partial [Agarophyton chilense]